MIGDILAKSHQDYHDYMRYMTDIMVTNAFMLGSQIQDLEEGLCIT